MIRLDRRGEHTGLESPLCRECPHGLTGCCASPPGFDWSDIGRVLSLDGKEWLKEQLAAGLILPLQRRYDLPARGLQLLRVANAGAASGVWATKCGYHGERGCTIDRDRRPATCNYYLCDLAYEMAGPGSDSAKEAHALLQMLYGKWDLQIATVVAERWPHQIPWREQPDLVLDLVDREYRLRVERDRRELVEVTR